MRVFHVVRGIQLVWHEACRMINQGGCYGWLTSACSRDGIYHWRVRARLRLGNDHTGLVNYYSQPAQDIKDKAKHWHFMVAFYEKHPRPQGTTERRSNAGHWLAMAQNIRMTADEADALATEHAPSGRME